MYRYPYIVSLVTESEPSFYLYEIVMPASEDAAPAFWAPVFPSLPIRPQQHGKRSRR